MTDPFVDTDVLIRLLTKDDLKKQAEAAALFEAVEAGKMIVLAPDTVVADAVYVLSSPRLYNLPRDQVSAMLTRLISLPAFKIDNRAAVIRALELYGSLKLDFGDAMIVASMEQRGSKVLYSYDTDFDRIPSIARQRPDTAFTKT